MHKETYCFTDDVDGLLLMLNLTMSLRGCGFKTTTATTYVAGFKLLTLTATPAERLSRKERGL